jgi:Tfp pilus tip-associated adhesin PilY1
MPLMISSDNARTYISFGTGKYLEIADTNVPFSTQAIYTMVDAEQLIPQALLVQASITSGKEFSAPAFVWWQSFAPINDPQFRAGWYLNLPSSASTGERMIYDMGLKDGVLVANSIIPSIGGCEVGDSRSYMINLRTGAGLYEDVKDQLLGGVFIAEGGFNVWIDPETGRVVGGSGGTTISGGTSGTEIGSGFPVTGAVIGILDWRQVHNYEQLKGNF